MTFVAGEDPAWLLVVMLHEGGSLALLNLSACDGSIESESMLGQRVKRIMVEYWIWESYEVCSCSET